MTKKYADAGTYEAKLEKVIGGSRKQCVRYYLSETSTIIRNF